MKNNLLPITAIKKLAKKHKLKLVILFGSATTKNLHPESDIDIAIYPSKKIKEEKLYEDLISIFKRTDLDIINIKKVYNHVLLFEILHKGITLYEATAGFKSTLEWQSYFDYVDFQPYLQQRSLLIDKKIVALMEQ